MYMIWIECDDGRLYFEQCGENCFRRRADSKDIIEDLELHFSFSPWFVPGNDIPPEVS